MEHTQTQTVGKAIDQLRAAQNTLVNLKDKNHELEVIYYEIDVIVDRLVAAKSNIQ